MAHTQPTEGTERADFNLYHSLTSLQFYFFKKTPLLSVYAKAYSENVNHLMYIIRKKLLY